MFLFLQYQDCLRQSTNVSLDSLTKCLQDVFRRFKFFINVKQVNSSNSINIEIEESHSANTSESIYTISYTSASIDQFKTFPKCPKVYCSIGNEIVYTKLATNATQWNESYRWTCQPCRKNYYKAEAGNLSCIPCAEYYVSNDQRSSCYDPYTTEIISLSKASVAVAVSLTVFGITSCVFVFVTFLKFRKTPVVKAADISMTIFHLITIAVNHALLLISFYGEPTILKCYSRMFAYTLFYTVIVTVILIRAQQVLKAFQSKVKMTKTEIRKSKAADFFLMLVLVLINNLILVVLVSLKQVTIQKVNNEQALTKISHCDISMNLNVFVGFAICLHVACFVQAFRGRRLPGVFKETMSIVYGNFICIVILIILYPIVLFQKDHLQQEVFYWIAITLSTDVLILFCYARRVFIAICRPDINTVEYSRAIVLQKMNKAAQKRIRVT